MCCLQMLLCGAQLQSVIARLPAMLNVHIYIDILVYVQCGWICLAIKRSMCEANKLANMQRTVCINMQLALKL